jgi:hypothetical protein
MPFGDRTGPLGQGPMTGRGRGFCAGNAVPRRFDPGPGFGLGRGGGGGRGRRNRFGGARSYTREVPAVVSPANADRQQEIAVLKAAVNSLGTTLRGIQKRLEELEAAKD